MSHVPLVIAVTMLLLFSTESASENVHEDSKAKSAASAVPDKVDERADQDGLPSHAPSQHADAADSSVRRVPWSDIEAQLSWHRASLEACGPLSAAYLLQRLGCTLPLSDWQRRIDHIEKAGVPVREVVEWCREADPSIKSWHIDVADAEKAIRALPVPCILLVDQSRHCVVMRDVYRHSSTGKTMVTIWDPARQTHDTVPWDHVYQNWNGGVIGRPRAPWWNSCSLLACLIPLQLACLWIFQARCSPIRKG